MRRKPRAPFVHVLKADVPKPDADQVRFTILPPGEIAWAEMFDESAGTYTRSIEAVIRFVVKAEGPGTEGFGDAHSKARRAFVDEVLGLDVILELADVIAETLLSVDDRKNSDSPSD